jgi:hypothetical protein
MLPIATSETLAVRRRREKANPDKVTQGIGPVGRMSDIGGILLQKETGTRFVSYRGSAPALQDLAAGQIDMAILDPTATLAQVCADLVNTAATRLSSAPEIPRRGCPAFACPYGKAFGCQRARRRTSSPSLTLRPSQPWPIQACARVSPILDWRFSRATSRPPRHFALCRRPRREMVANHQGGRHQGGMNNEVSGQRNRKSCPRRRQLSYAAVTECGRRLRYRPASTDLAAGVGTSFNSGRRGWRPWRVLRAAIRRAFRRHWYRCKMQT